MLLVGTLSEDAEPPQPGTHACRVPTVTVARDHELMPVAAPLVARHGAAEGFRRRTHGVAVGLRSRGVAHRLTLQVAAIAHEVTEQHQRVVRPIGCGRILRSRRRTGQPVRQRHPVARREFVEGLPTGAGEHTMRAGGAQAATARQMHTAQSAHADRPDEIGLRGDQPPALVQGPDFGLPTHEFADRDAGPIREADQGIARHALAQVGHHRLLVDALLDAAVELRERDDRHAQLLGERLEAARDLGDLGGAVLLVARHLHELQVVDDHEPEPVLAGHAARAGAQLRRRQRRRLVDEDLGLGQLPRRAGDARPVVVADAAAADVAEAHPADR